MSKENIRNQHKNSMKDRPLGQTSIDQRFGEPLCYICGIEEPKHDDKVCKTEYNNG
jgi:hypothetical protein